MKTLFVASAIVLVSFLCREAHSHFLSKKPRPHIIFIMMADLGWNDIGAHDSNMVTPNIDKLYNEGFRMNYTYADPSGSASRAALLSGNFSFTMGLQDGAINPFSSAHVPLTHELLPSALKRHGYFTHMVGRWDQGFCHLDKTPTYRGFDSFFGEYTSASNDTSVVAEEGAHAFREKVEAEKDPIDASIYSTDLYAKQAMKIIKRHARKFPGNLHPFFILLSFTAVGKPNQIPGSHKRACKDSVFPNEKRRDRCAMMSAVDKAISRLTQALEDTNQIDDTLIVFTSDNGGATRKGSSNFPLRGSKGTVWEGGIRVPSFMWGGSNKFLPVQNMTYRGMFHMVDWYPTLVGFARKIGRKVLKTNHAPPMHGLNHYRLIKKGVTHSYRKEFAYMVNETKKEVTYIHQRGFKMVLGETRYTGWYNKPNMENDTVKKEYYKNRPFRVYNIYRDPAEMKDLSRSKSERNIAARNDLLLALDKYHEMYKAKQTPSLDAC